MHIPHHSMTGWPQCRGEAGAPHFREYDCRNKKQMSANELRIAVDELMALGGEFKSKVNEICTGCAGEDCPYLWDENDDI